jgi:hypothetical protein
MSGAYELKQIDQEIFLMWTTEYVEPAQLKRAHHFLPTSDQKRQEVVEVEEAPEYATAERPYVYRVIVKPKDKRV